MKVGMLIWTYWPGPEGGAERQCRKVVCQLEKGNIDCVVLTSLSSYKLKRRSTDGRVAVRRYGILCPFAEHLRKFLSRLARWPGVKYEKYFRTMIFWLMLPVEWLARLSFIIEVLLAVPCNRFDVEILHVHETAWLAGFGALIGRRWKIPVVCKVRNTPALEIIGYDTPFRRVWNRLRNDVSFVALHRELEQELLSSGFLAEKIAVIPNGVELPDLTMRKPNPGKVVYVGNFSQGASHKDFDTLLRAWSEVIKDSPKARLTLVGGGDYRIWKALAKDLGCLDTVTFAGGVADPKEYYCEAEVFVLPSKHEGMSNALLEAQSWGIPCVVSDIPANVAIVCNGQNGLTFPVGDYQAMALNILNLLSDLRLSLTLGMNARQRIETTFNIERVTGQLVTVYKATAKEAKSV